MATCWVVHLKRTATLKMCVMLLQRQPSLGHFYRADNKLYMATGRLLGCTNFRSLCSDSNMLLSLYTRRLRGGATSTGTGTGIGTGTGTDIERQISEHGWYG